jgi:hypothetical protein
MTRRLTEVLSSGDTSKLRTWTARFTCIKACHGLTGHGSSRAVVYRRVPFRPWVSCGETPPRPGLMGILWGRAGAHSGWLQTSLEPGRETMRVSKRRLGARGSGDRVRDRAARTTWESQCSGSILALPRAISGVRGRLTATDKRQRSRHRQSSGGDCLSGLDAAYERTPVGRTELKYPVPLENRIRLLACGFVVASGGSAVFVYQPVQYGFSADSLDIEVDCCDAGSFVPIAGDALGDALVRPGDVVVHLVFGQHGA